MDAPSFSIGALVIGLLLIGMALVGTLLKRLPLSPAMLYLAVGYALGTAGADLVQPDPARHAALLERATEVVVLLSLFSVGSKLGVPLSSGRWRLSLRLAFTSMAVTVALVAALGVYGLGLPVGAAILLGAILAPTDPVLASDVQVTDPEDRDRLRFALSGEGGLNDGTAFPFVMLGLGLLGLHELGERGVRWLAVDVLWAVGAGLATGALLGFGTGRLILHLRVRHRTAVGQEEFVALGVVALAYGVSTLMHAYGFLAVFAAGVALQRVRATPVEAVPPAGPPETPAVHPQKAGEHLINAVQGFNEQLDRICELLIVLLVGAMLPYARWSAALPLFVALLLGVIRPLSAAVGLAGADLRPYELRLIAWFGIRGIGSLYYLMYAFSHGFAGPVADEVYSLTLGTVAVSVVVHGVSVTPLMERYAARRGGRSAGRDERRR